ncbi:MAG: TIGR03087 family PEP-CTERM/XrtA system glycosyltransferase [Nitrospirales bacterium]|nr:TIGR03087 family PEP-CTERM/XrtA system glycosyltransferase [Nitrospira sp.]MDR4501902.1 TIGR03087 family PEP-CTERM/XrtA system glycosyltransferase [Nitrospirales bacterium]
MNILYLAHRIPYPPNKGDKIRSYHQIQYLSVHHRVYLACIADDPQEFQYVDELRKYCQQVEVIWLSQRQRIWGASVSLLRGQALSVGAFYSQDLQEKIDRILQSVPIDHIIAFSSPMAEYVRKVKNVPRLMDFVDVDSEKWRAYAGFQKFPWSVLYQLEANRLGDYEERIAEEFEQSVFISTQEVQLFCERGKDRRAAVVSNGVDIEYFYRNGHGSRASVDRPVLVFTAAMDYFPNIDAVQYFCREILPKVRQVFPDVRFNIVGRRPTHAVEKLASPGHIHVTGTVPDVRPYLIDASVAVVPLRIARGVQNKILEAMAMGLPVVGTSAAFEGLTVSQDNGIRIADDPQRFADEIVCLLNDPVLRSSCAEQAREFVAKRCSWQHCGSELEKLVEQAGR